MYTDVFHLAKGEEPYYVKLDYEERENIVWLKEYDFGLVKSNNPTQKQKGKEVYESMRNELKNSEYIQEAKKP